MARLEPGTYYACVARCRDADDAGLPEPLEVPCRACEAAVGVLCDFPENFDGLLSADEF